MTQDEAAEALEQLVRARGPNWVSHTWGIARDRLAGWLEGSEDLPERMVVVMRAHVSGQGCGDAGCFEDRDHPSEPVNEKRLQALDELAKQAQELHMGYDHPPEVPEDVTETGLDAVPMPTVGRGELLWDHYRLKTHGVYNTGLRELERYAWQAAGARYDVDVVGDHNWLVAEFPLADWPKNLPWDRLVDWLAEHIDDFLGIE